MRTARIVLDGCLLLFLGSLAGGLKAQSPPFISTPPQDTVASVSGSASFYVYAYGEFPLTYYWLFNNTTLVGSNSPSFHIDYVTTNHEGSYSVIVSNSAGTVTSSAARLTVLPMLPGLLDRTFDPGTGADGGIRSVALAGADGKIMVAGVFNHFDGTERHGVARLNSNGSVDGSFDAGAGPDNGLYTMALDSAGNVLVGGAFWGFSGVSNKCLTRLTSSGAVDPSFNTGEGFNAPVWAIAIQPNGKIVVAGDFSTANFAPRAGIARLNNDGSLDNTFNPGSGLDGVARSLALQPDGRVVVAGNFTSVNGTSRIRVARLDSNGQLDPTFNPGSGASDWIYATALQPDGKLVIGGSFFYINNFQRNRVARLNSDGSLDPSFDPGAGPDSFVTALAIESGGKIVIGGGFSTVQGKRKGHMARLQSNGTVDGLFGTDIFVNNIVESIVLQPNGSILIGGFFTAVDGISRNGVARLIGGEAEPFAPIFTRQPVSQTIREGTHVTFSVTTIGNPEPALRWQFNGSDIPGAVRDDLTLFNARLGRAGNYTAVLSNSVGSVTSVTAVLTITPARTTPGAPDIDFYAGTGPDNGVMSVAVQADNKVVAGGWFMSVDGLVRGGIVRFNPDGTIDSAFGPLVNNAVYSVAVQGDGKLLIGGVFSQVNNIPRVGFTRLNADGSLDPGFSPFLNVNGAVSTIVTQLNGKILIGGYFSSVNGLPRYGVARLETNGELDLTFDPGSGANETVHALAVQPNGAIVIAGGFTRFNGEDRARIARLNSNGTVDPSFDAGSGASGNVYTLALLANGKIVLGGEFTKINGVTRNGIARLNADGSLDNSFDAGTGANNTVHALAMQPNGKILIGGTFTAVNDQSRVRLARLTSNGGLDPAFDPEAGLDQFVNTIALTTNNTAYVGGFFNFVDLIPRPRIARILTGEAVRSDPVIYVQPETETFRAGQDAAVSVLASGVPELLYQWHQNGAPIPGATNWILRLLNIRVANAGTYTVSVANGFGSVLSAPAQIGVTPALRQAGAVDIDFGSLPGPNNRVVALAVQQDHKILIGGEFTAVDGVDRNRLARLQANGQLDLSFNPGSGIDRRIVAMALQNDGKVVIGGGFDSVNGVPRGRLARLNTNGTLDVAFAPLFSSNALVNAVAVQTDGKILVGGFFTNINGLPRANVARLLSNGAVDLSFDPRGGPNGGIYAVAPYAGDKVLIGGSFYVVNTNSRSGFARLNSDGSFDSTFGSETANVGGIVFSIAVAPDQKVVIGGNFYSVGNQIRRALARMNSDGLLDATFDPAGATVGNVSSVLVQQDGKVIAGGDFNLTLGSAANRFVRLNTNGTPDLTFHVGSGATLGTTIFDEYGELIDRSAVFCLAEDGNGVFLGGDFTRIDGYLRPYIGRIYGRDPSQKINISIVFGAARLVQLDWELGVLQQAPDLNGPWVDVTVATSPHRVAPGGSQRFFRLRID